MEHNSINPTEDLRAIRQIMEQSSKFLSLSGLAGIFAGICALTGAAVAWFLILQPEQEGFAEFIHHPDTMKNLLISIRLIVDGSLVFLFAVAGAIYFSVRKAKKAGLSVLNSTSQRLVVHLLIPLFTGAIFCVILVIRNDMELIAPVMLIFYGLSLINAGKFTLGEVHYLGLTEIVLGILATIFVDLGLIFWTIGFGFMHILYGAVMYFRYEREEGSKR